MTHRDRNRTKRASKQIARRSSWEHLEQRVVLSGSPTWVDPAPSIAETSIGYRPADSLNPNAWRIEKGIDFQTERHHGRRESFEFVWEPAADEGPLATANALDATSFVPISQLPQLSSNPGAQVDLFLDFDGHYEAQWGAYNNALTPVYDIDGDETTFSEAELSRIQEAFAIVAEDFAPFNINVTTVQPAVLADEVPDGQANGVALRVAIGGSYGDWYGSASSGVGYIDSFTSSIPNVVYVFSDNAGSTFGETASHEAGHGFGLRHQSLYDAQGTLLAEYNPGTHDWSPIMGGGSHGSTITSTWHNGPSVLGPTAYQDDMAVLARAQNGFGYRADDHGDSIGTATALATAGASWTGAGIIETNDDLDVFSLTTGGEKIRIDVDGAPVGPNLDVVLRLRDASGAVIASADPADELGASFRQVLPAGDYYLDVTKTSTYGWVGTYSINGLVVAPGPFITGSSPSGIVSDTSLSSVRVSFEQAIDPATFDPDDVHLTGPQGPIPVSGVTAVAGSGNQVFDVEFPLQTTAGAYDFVIGVDSLDPIRDPSGNPLNQDEDAAAGEPVDDQYRSRITLGVFGWAFQFESNDGILTKGIAAGPDGAIYVAGNFRKTVDFDPGPGKALYTSISPNFFDGFVAKYSSSKELLWVRTFGGGDGSDNAKDVQVDSLGNVYVSGHSNSSVVTIGNFTLVNHGSFDVFLTKLDADGNFLWARSWGGPGLDDPGDDALHVDGERGSYIAGSFQGTTDFDPGSGVFERTAAGSSDEYLLHLDKDGQFVWALAVGGPAAENIREIAGDGAGNVYASGDFRDTAQFGTTNGSDPVLLTSQGENDGFLMKVNQLGHTQWVRQAASVSSNSANAVAVDASGNAYWAGDVPDLVDVGPGVAGFVASGNADAFITKWNTDGGLLWSGQLSGTDTMQLRYLGVDAANNLFAVGSQSGTVDFDPGPGVVERSTLSGTDFFWLQLDLDGGFQEVSRYTLEGSYTQVPQIAVDSISNRYMTYYFPGTISFPTGEALTNMGSYVDSYVLKITRAPGVSISPSLGLVTNEAGGQATFDVVLDFPPTADVTIDLLSSQPSEGSVSTTSMTFTPDDWQTPQTVTVTGVDDGALDGDVAYWIVTSAVTSADPGYDGLDPRDVSVANLDNEQPIVVFADSFESSEWNGLWVEDAQNDWFRSTQRASHGNRSAEVDGSASNATLTMASAVDLTEYGSVELSFSWYIESGFDAGEYLALDLFNGTWQNNVAILRGNVEQENTWHNERFAIGSEYLVGNFTLRFRSSVDSSLEDANLDNVQLLATSLAGPPNMPPVAGAGGPYAGAEGSNVSLNGTASFDPDGTIAGYAWDLDDDGQYDDATGPTPTFSTTADGVFTVRLQVTDDSGGVATDTATVTIANVAPTADAGGPYTGSEGENITLSASGSSDPGLDIANYAWDFDDDGQFDDAFGIGVAFLPGNEGVFNVALRVTDDDGAISTGATSVRVSNVAPIVDAGGPYAGEVGVATTFAGSAIDPGSDTLTYEWDFDYDGSTFTVDASGVNLTNTSYTYSVGANYTVALRVSDGTTASALATTTVAISQRPVAEANGPYVADEGTAVSFNSSGSHDTDGTIVSYVWDFGDGSIGNGPSPSHAYADNGNFSVTLIVTDNAGLTAVDQSPVTIGNVAPSANAGTSYSGDEGTPISFAGSASDPSNDVLTYHWDFDYDGATFTVDASGVNLTSPSHTYAAEGTYTVALWVTDDDGGVSAIAAGSVWVADVPVADDVLYFSLLSNANVGGISVANEDIAVLETDGGVRLLFDGSDVGLGSLVLDAFDVISDYQLLLSFTDSASVSGVGTVDDSDLLLFTATSLGSTTAGSFSMYFDGSDVGLTTTSEDIDAVHRLDDGRLVISTTGSAGVTGVSATAADLIVFTPNSLGPSTSGSWTMYVDASDVGLSTSDENVDAATVDAAGKIYLSTTGNFSVNGVAGADEDVLVFTPTSLGGSTSGSFNSTLYFDGSLLGLASNDLTGIDLPESSGAAAIDHPRAEAGAAATPAAISMASERQVKDRPSKKAADDEAVTLLAREQLFAAWSAPRKVPRPVEHSWDMDFTNDLIKTHRQSDSDPG